MPGLSGGGQEQVALCRRCDTKTTHRRDPAGILRCVRCVIEDSLPGNDAPTPMASPVVEVPEEPRKIRIAEIAAACVSILVVAFLVFAFAKRC